MVLDPIPQSLPVHFFVSRPQPPTSRNALVSHNSAPSCMLSKLKSVFCIGALYTFVGTFCEYTKYIGLFCTYVELFWRCTFCHDIWRCTLCHVFLENRPERQGFYTAGATRYVRAQVAVCSSVLQRVTACCSVLQCGMETTTPLLQSHV